MSVFKNRQAPKLSGANCHAKFSHSKQLLKIIHPVMFTDEKDIFSDHIKNLPKNHQLHATAATKKQDIATDFGRR